MRSRAEGTKHWGGLVRELREEHGMSQRCAAREAGVNRKTLMNIESGLNSPSIIHIERLLALYGYELEAVKIQA